MKTSENSLVEHKEILFYYLFIFSTHKLLSPSMLHGPYVQAGHHPFQHAELLLLVLNDPAQLLGHCLAACGTVFEEKATHDEAMMIIRA